MARSETSHGLVRDACPSAHALEATPPGKEIASYAGPMGEAAAETPGTETTHSFSDASPGRLRAALTPKSAGEFDRQWRDVMARAIESLDLVELFQVLAGWRQVAALTTQLGHDGYRDFEARTKHRMAERRAAGSAAQVGVGVEEIDAQIRERLAQAR
jgi:hypothetical protein